MFCIVALIVLSILGIFSATNRALAREALDCVLRRVTFRPCTTGFDQKMKAKILGKVLGRSEKAAIFISKNFELLAWIFFILSVASLFFTLRGLFFFYQYGSCNGLNQTGVCVFDPKGENSKVSNVANSCNINSGGNNDLTLNSVDLSLFPVKNADAKDKLVFIGCYECEYTRKAYPLIQQLIKDFSVSYTFAHYPTKSDTNYLGELGMCIYQQDQDKYWKFNDAIFASDLNKLGDQNYINQVLTDLDVDNSKIQLCMFGPQIKELIASQVQELEKTHLYGTPTIFINGEALVGPKPYRVYAIQLKGLLYWLR